MAAAAVGHTLSSMVEQVASTQGEGHTPDQSAVCFTEHDQLNDYNCTSRCTGEVCCCVQILETIFYQLWHILANQNWQKQTPFVPKMDQ